MTIWQTTPERADAYVLGLMDDEERLRLEQELESNADLARAVGEARDRFIELDMAGPVSVVSPGLWTRIEQTLETGVLQETAASPGRLRPANDNIAGRWRHIALSAIAASLMLVAVLAYGALQPSEPQVIAILMNAEGEPVVMIEDFGNDTAKVTPLVDTAVPGDRSPQLWTLPTADMGPVSLGVLDGWKTVTVAGPELPGPQEEQLYEITLEPLGGSPTGRPTGPILGKGFAKAPRL
jgi:anti-sigma-K factor RskA